MEPERSRMIAMRVKLSFIFPPPPSVLDRAGFGWRRHRVDHRLLDLERGGDALSRRPPSVVDVAQVLRRNPEPGRELLGSLLSLLLLQELHELIEIHSLYGHNSSIRHLTYPSSDVRLRPRPALSPALVRILKPAPQRRCKAECHEIFIFIDTHLLAVRLVAERWFRSYDFPPPVPRPALKRWPLLERP